MAKIKSEFRCTECGWVTYKWVGQCGECQSWDTLSESTTAPKEVKAARISNNQMARPITEIEIDAQGHRPTGVS
jgi:DNA repair protein RadA/Sms